MGAREAQEGEGHQGVQGSKGRQAHALGQGALEVQHFFALEVQRA